LYGVVSEIVIDVMYNGSDEVDPLVIFESYELNELKHMTDLNIEKKRQEKEEKNKEAKRLGLLKKNKEEKPKESAKDLIYFV
jgi:hypothetical protein